MRVMKRCLASWRHSADTAANARTSKVIHGRIRDTEPCSNWKLSGARGKFPRRRLRLSRESDVQGCRAGIVLSPAAHRGRWKNTSAIFLFRREHDKPASVALLPKNGRHRQPWRGAETVRSRARGDASK